MNGEGRGGGMRSVGAVLGGLIAIFALSIGTDVVLHAVRIYPPWDQPISDWQALLATAYRILYAVVGGYLTARLAPRRPLRHAIALGLVGIVLSTVGAVATWNHVPSMGPHWYPVALVLISLPCSWLGGKIYAVSS